MNGRVGTGQGFFKFRTFNSRCYLPLCPDLHDWSNVKSGHLSRIIGTALRNTGQHADSVHSSRCLSQWPCWTALQQKPHCSRAASMPMPSAQCVAVVAAAQPLLSLQELPSPLRTVPTGTSDGAFTHGQLRQLGLHPALPAGELTIHRGKQKDLTGLSRHPSRTKVI